MTNAEGWILEHVQTRNLELLDPSRERFGDDFGLGEVKAHDRASSRGQGQKRPKAPRPQGEKEESCF